jgi:hypothetical protein
LDKRRCVTPPAAMTKRASDLGRLKGSAVFGKMIMGIRAKAMRGKN